jgi:hypothetical protein
LVRKFALYFGIVYLAVGILGFLPFLGGSYSLDSKKLLGIFTINVIHNLVHLVIGVAGIAMSNTIANATLFAKVFGIFLIVVGVVGIFPIAAFDTGGLLPIHGLDVILHLATGLLAAYFGFRAPEGTLARA